MLSRRLNFPPFINDNITLEQRKDAEKRASFASFEADAKQAALFLTTEAAREVGFKNLTKEDHARIAKMAFDAVEAFDAESNSRAEAAGITPK